ncbi:DnaA regulatory inactivator Hda [Halioxenophilus sp. WMMB6]|uniref:DnaA regulatory inactivator Hda n=1 Tax=Halioxenophilus sp. WMMB6 TaxID=3073815 RepID=UPI00295EE6C6|nr:DnaA regulatory inactivator Hda [Halioxenophilus sp. WMMB6]
MANNSQQLPLAVSLDVEASFDNYYLPEHSPNLTALQTLFLMVQGQGELVSYLWGERDVGLSHLLQACSQLAPSFNLQACYLSLAPGNPPLTGDLLDELAAADLVCLDDVDQVAGDDALEQEIFALFNCLRDRAARVIFAGHRSPAQLAFKLADLQSRILWGPVFQVHALSDEDKAKALQLQAHRLGLKLPEEAAGYIVNHSARNLGSLFEFLKLLDRESLAQQRRLTIPFIKQCLQA